MQWLLIACMCWLNIYKELLAVHFVSPSYLHVLSKNTTCNQTTGLHQLVYHKVVMSLPSSGHRSRTRMRRGRGLALLLLLSAVVESNSKLKGAVSGLQTDISFLKCSQRCDIAIHSNMSCQKHYALDNQEHTVNNANWISENKRNRWSFGIKTVYKVCEECLNHSFTEPFVLLFLKCVLYCVSA